MISSILRRQIPDTWLIYAIHHNNLSLAKPCADDMDDQEAFEGDDFTFQIDCDGNPKPVAKWTKEGKGIDTKDGHFTITQADPNAYRLSIKGT